MTTQKHNPFPKDSETTPNCFSAINVELLGGNRKLNKMKKRSPIALGGGLAAAFIIPFLPGRRGGKAMIEYIDYHYAVIINFVVFLIIYGIGYEIKRDRIRTKMQALYVKKRQLEEKKSNKFKHGKRYIF